MLELSGPNNKVQLTLMNQARGRPLASLWPKLSKVQRESYIHQMAAIIQQLRRFRKPTAQRVDGSLLDDLLIGNCLGNRPPSCMKIGSTSEDWLDALAPTLCGGISRIYKTTDPAIIEAELQKLRANFPSGGP
jgi:hypothetical protein